MEKLDIRNSLTNREENSKKLPVLFYNQIIFDEKASKENKKLIFKNVPYIQIETGNETGSDIKTFPVNDEFKKRYREQWLAFNNFIDPLIKTYTNEVVDISTIKEEYPDVYNNYVKNIKEIADGKTLIEELGIYPLTKAIELKYNGYFFIEQILNLKEENDIITTDMLNIAKKWKEKQEENVILKKQVLELTVIVKKMAEELKRYKNV